MNPFVRDLYKRILYAGRDYPAGLSKVRIKAKEAFYENKDLKDDIDIKKAVAYGRYMVREMYAISKLAKYRALRNRYGNETK